MQASSTFHEEKAFSPLFMSKHEFDTSTPEDGKLALFEKFDNLNATKINENSMENALIDADMTFNVKRLSSCQTFIDNSNSLLNRNINNNNSTKINPTSLRQELLEEVERSSSRNSHESESKMMTTMTMKKKELNTTYENSSEAFSAPIDYYKTYKKDSLKKVKEIGRFQTFRKTTNRDETFMKKNDHDDDDDDVVAVNATFSKNNEGQNFDATYSSNEILNVTTTFSKNDQVPEKIVNSTFCKTMKKAEIPVEVKFLH